MEKDNQYIGGDPILQPFISKRYELEFFFVPSGCSQTPLTVKFMAF